MIRLLARLILLIVAIAPVARATCDASCLRIPEPVPPPCHKGATDEQSDDCSHDHARLVARLAVSSIALHVAVLPTVALPSIVPPPVAVYSKGEGIPLTWRASPQTILRV